MSADPIQIQFLEEAKRLQPEILASVIGELDLSYEFEMFTSEQASKCILEIKRMMDEVRRFWDMFHETVQEISQSRWEAQGEIGEQSFAMMDGISDRMLANGDHRSIYSAFLYDRPTPAAVNN
mgnify:CR=1 FL=1